MSKRTIFLDNLSSYCMKTIEKRCKCIFKLFFSGKDEHKSLKIIVGFIYGVILGLGFYEIILVDLEFSDIVAFVIGGVISLVLGLGIAFSSQIRCITLLSIPSFAGKAGRGVLKAVVLAYILCGPIQNLSNNGKEVARVFACTTSLTYNLTKTRFELMLLPFAKALFGLKADASEVKDTLRSIRAISAPITDELEGESETQKSKEENDYVVEETNNRNDQGVKVLDDGEKVDNHKDEGDGYEKKYLRKIETRCLNQFAKGAMNCRKMFGKAYDSCYETVTWIAAWLLCWPMKLTFVCNVPQALGGSNVCDPSKDVDSDFGEGYVYLKESRDTLGQNFRNVKLQYRVITAERLENVRDAADTAKAILHTIDNKKALLDGILIILRRILAFIFVRVLFCAQEYHDKYLRDIEYDNIYVTKYFRRIDNRRYASGKRNLLPLKKIETTKLVDPWHLTPLKRECEELGGQTLKLALEIITATTFILLDRMLYEALDLVRRHARIEYMQVGHHDMTLQVKGTGLIASLLRSLIKGFNVKQRIKTIQSNEPCLPRPTALPTYYLIKIYGTYFAVWLLILLQAFILRTRRVVCSYFYRKREKKRVLFIYNETLKRRVGFFKYMKKEVKKLARERRLQEDLNIFAVLRVRFPKACKCLRLFAVSRRKCIICGDPEPRKKRNLAGDFEPCKTPTCYFVHCAECWFDMGRVCFACMDSSTDTSDFEASDKDNDTD